MLRAARALIQAKVSRRRISRSLEDLRQHLPETMPLSGLSICAVGDRVVVRDGKSHWQVDDGQYLLGLDVSVENGVLRVVERKEEAAAPPEPTQRTSRTGSTSDSSSKAPIPQRRSAGLRARRRRPTRRTSPRGSTGAGCCTSRARRTRPRAIYRRALEQCGPDAVLMFNFGVLLEDLGRTGAGARGVSDGDRRRSESRRLPLQPRAPVRIARQAAARDPASRAVPATRHRRDRR